MPANLLVSFNSHGSLLKVGSFQNGVFAKFVLDIQKDVLEVFFFGIGLFFQLQLLGFSLVVSKEVKLLGLIFFPF